MDVFSPFGFSSPRITLLHDLMPTVHIETFGCQMNAADSARLEQLLAARGYHPAESVGEADLIVVNTCSVREKAENRALARIQQYCTTRKAGSHLWVIGCMAERMGERLRRRFPGIDTIIGAPSMEHIAGDIDGYLQGVAITGDRAPRPSAPVSAFVPVMRGCDNFCSYCIVPHVRGREHSVSWAELETTIGELVRRGTVEVTLLGQNVNSYCCDGIDFAGLLKRVHGIPGIKRIRFTTSHPKDFSDRLVETMAELPGVCNHVHLPVQSGSSRILGLMKRGYDREAYLAKIDMLRRRIPEVDITTDAMVGFPTESREEFEETCSLFQSVRFTTAFMFAYSPREGTGAFAMRDDISREEKRRRLNRLIAIQTSITKQKYGDAVGRELEVLATERQRRRDRHWMGSDYGCKRVLVACRDDLAGTILRVHVDASSGMTLVGRRAA